MCKVSGKKRDKYGYRELKEMKKRDEKIKMKNEMEKLMGKVNDERR
jgi:hypothetical protein